MLALTDHEPLPRRRFMPGYREDVLLHGGRRARLSLLLPSHAPLVARGFERLSSRSRYLRFFTNKKSLGADELRYLTELDGEHHFALAAAMRSADGWEGAGVARFVALPDHPGAAEPALTVVDAVQGTGLGTMLFERLCAAARERGYTQLRAAVLPENRSMLRVMKRVSPTTIVRFREGWLELEVPLAGDGEAAPRRSRYERDARLLAREELAVGQEVVGYRLESR
jgi:GNAT superfamily N-acetyltransferase